LPAGFKKLLDRLKKAGIGPEGSLSSMQATGHYWVALFNFMAAYGYGAAIIDPIQSDAFRDVWTLRTLKTDAIDAAMIAGLMRYKCYEPCALSERGAARAWARYRASLAEELDYAQNPRHSHPRRPVQRLV
jgi:transposase